MRNMFCGCLWLWRYAKLRGLIRNDVRARTRAVNVGAEAGATRHAYDASKRQAEIFSGDGR